MTEPPVHTGVDEVQAYAHKTGRRWVDMAIALSAITISVISLVVAIEHGRTEEKLVAASSWPFLVFQASEDGAASDLHTLSFRLRNSGVGPARVRAFRVTLDGRPIHSHTELLASCCAEKAATVEDQIGLGLVSQNDPVGVIPAREGVDLLTWRSLPRNRSIFRGLKSARKRLRFMVCYCSVLSDCWTSDLTSAANPRPVHQCFPSPEDYTG